VGWPLSLRGDQINRDNKPVSGLEAALRGASTENAVPLDVAAFEPSLTLAEPKERRRDGPGRHQT